MAIVAAIAVPHPPLIVPAVGRGEQAKIQATIDAYELATRRLLDQAPDVLVITSPHAAMFREAFHVTTDVELRGDMSRFRAPQETIRAECDVLFAREVIRQAQEMGIPAIDSDCYRDEMDHGTYVPLHFVREAWRKERPDAVDDLPCPIVRIGLSGMYPQVHRLFGRAIAKASDSLDRRVGFIASGDLSHKLLEDGPYGFAPEGPVFDKYIDAVFTSGDLEGLFQLEERFCDYAAECGLRSFQTMAGALDGLNFTSSMLSNEGPFGVGYGVATFMPVAHLDSEAGPDDCDPYVSLARLSVETFVRTGVPAHLPPDLAPELLDARAGVFVSLHKQGELRGCIGTISATTGSVAEEVLQNGISACSRDPRFPAVSADELDYLEYSVDVLGIAEPAVSEGELDPKRYGVIVTKGSRRGLLLPNLEGVDTVAEQLSIAKRKAGIDPADQDVHLERFEVVRHTRGGEPRKNGGAAGEGRAQS